MGSSTFCYLLTSPHRGIDLEVPKRRLLLPRAEAHLQWPQEVVEALRDAGASGLACLSIVERELGESSSETL